MSWPGAWCHSEPYAINRIEAGHGRLTSRRRPMRGFTTGRGATVVIIGNAFIQNIRCGHYELGIEQRLGGSPQPSASW
jgi:IS6 family transposase